MYLDMQQAILREATKGGVRDGERESLAVQGVPTLKLATFGNITINVRRKYQWLNGNTELELNLIMVSTLNLSM